jgi:hypothetical protein
MFLFSSFFFCNIVCHQSFQNQSIKEVEVSLLSNYNSFLFPFNRKVVEEEEEEVLVVVVQMRPFGGPMAT